MNLAAVIFARGGQRTMRDKNLRPVAGRILCSWPALAACQVRDEGGPVKAVFVSTNDRRIAAACQPSYWLQRPADLSTAEAPLEAAIAFAWQQVWAAVDEPLDGLVILQGNAPYVDAALIRRAVAALEDNPTADAAATVVEASAFAPARARVLSTDPDTAALLVHRALPDLAAGSDRHAHPTYFGDGAVVVTRAAVLDAMHRHPGPYPWWGTRTVALVQHSNPGDIDHEWQIKAAAWCVEHHVAAPTTREGLPWD